MNLKNLYISAAILAVLAIAVRAINSSSASIEADARVGETIAKDETLRDTQSIRIAKGEETLTIERDPSLSGWKMAERFGMPVRMKTLTDQVSAIVTAELIRVVTSNPEKHESLGFSNATTVAFSNGDGDSILSLEIGRSADNGRQFVRHKGEDTIFLTNTALSIDTNPTSWLEKRLLNYEADDVVTVSMALANSETATFARAGSSADWLGDAPDGKAFDKVKTNRAIDRLANLSFIKTENPEHEDVVAARENSHRFTLTLSNGVKYEYTIGRRPEVKTMAEVTTEEADGETKTEMKEEVDTPAGPAYVFIESSENDDPINHYMSQSAFEVGSFNFTSLPKELEEILRELPEIDEEGNVAEKPEVPLPMALPPSENTE